MTDKPTKIEFEDKYADGSGVEYAVRADFSSGLVMLEHVDSIEIPKDRLDWFIDKLTQIREI